MSDALALEWVVNVQGRFTRSVSLVRDAGRPDALGGRAHRFTRCEAGRR